MTFVHPYVTDEKTETQVKSRAPIQWGRGGTGIWSPAEGVPSLLWNRRHYHVLWVSTKIKLAHDQHNEMLTIITSLFWRWREPGLGRGYVRSPHGVEDAGSSTDSRASLTPPCFRTSKTAGGPDKEREWGQPVTQPWEPRTHFEDRLESRVRWKAIGEASAEPNVVWRTRFSGVTPTVVRRMELRGGRGRSTGSVTSWGWRGCVDCPGSVQEAVGIRDSNSALHSQGYTMLSGSWGRFQGFLLDRGANWGIFSDSLWLAAKKIYFIPLNFYFLYNKSNDLRKIYDN